MSFLLAIASLQALVSSDVSQSKHFKASDLRKCLKNEHMVFLGDSSMTERVQDVALIYSEAYLNSTRVDEFIRSPIHGNCRTPPTIPSNFSFGDDFKLSFFNNQRNFTMSSASTNFSAHFRFTGHYSPIENHLGIRTWLHPHFTTELQTTLGLDRPPDTLPSALVLNSAQHDASNHVDPFDPAFFQRTLVTFLANTYRDFAQRNHTTLQIYWLGTLISQRIPVASTLHIIEDIAKTVISSMPTGHYVDTSEVLPSFANSSELITVDNMHFGINARTHDRAVTGNASTMATKLLLSAICCDRSLVSPQLQLFCPHPTLTTGNISSSSSDETRSSSRSGTVLSLRDAEELSILFSFRGFAYNCSNKKVNQAGSGIPAGISTNTTEFLFLDAGWIRPIPSPQVLYTLSVGPHRQIFNYTSINSSHHSPTDRSRTGGGGDVDMNTTSSSSSSNSSSSSSNTSSNTGCIPSRLWNLLPIGPDVSLWLVNDALIRPVNEKNVYIVKEGYRSRINSAGTMIKYGWTFDDVKVISEHDAVLLPLGPVVY